MGIVGHDRVSALRESTAHDPVVAAEIFAAERRPLLNRRSEPLVRCRVAPKRLSQIFRCEANPTTEGVVDAEYVLEQQLAVDRRIESDVGLAGMEVL